MQRSVALQSCTWSVNESSQEARASGLLGNEIISSFPIYMRLDERGKPVLEGFSGTRVILR